MTKDMQSLVARYKQEYQRVNNRAPEIQVKNGWIRIDNTPAIRRPTLFFALKTLETRANFA